MKRTIIFWVCAIIAFCLASCTKYDDVKYGRTGATLTQKLPKGQHVLTVTWKDAGFWVLSRNRDSTETIDTLNFDCYDGYDENDKYSSRLTLIEQ
jgi:hypothetical protein